VAGVVIFTVVCSWVVRLVL